MIPITNNHYVPKKKKKKEESGFSKFDLPFAFFICTVCIKPLNTDF